MTKTNETKLAEHEIRLNNVEAMLPKIGESLEQINRKLKVTKEASPSSINKE